MSPSLPPLGVDEKLPILKKDRASTGIRELDIILEGGYQHPGAIMIRGPPGMEKVALAFHFATAKKDNFVVFIAADAGPDSIQEKASTLGMNLETDNIRFIDCYSATVSSVKKSDVTESAKYAAIPGPTALNDLSLAINEMIKQAGEKRLCVIFYSLSAFLIYNSKDSILKFLQVINGRLKNANATIVFLVEEGVHEKALLSSVERLMDERFAVQIGKEGFLELEITELSENIKMKMGPNGIIVS